MTKVYLLIQHFEDEMGEEDYYNIFSTKELAQEKFKDCVDTLIHNTYDIEEVEITQYDNYYSLYDPYTYSISTISIIEIELDNKE